MSSSILLRSTACAHHLKRRLVALPGAAFRAHARQQERIYEPPKSTQHIASPPPGRIYGVGSQRFEAPSQEVTVRLVIKGASSLLNPGAESDEGERRRLRPTRFPRRLLSRGTAAESQWLPLEESKTDAFRSPQSIRCIRFSTQSKTGSSSEPTNAATSKSADATPVTESSSGTPAIPTAESIYSDVIVADPSTSSDKIVSASASAPASPGAPLSNPTSTASARLLPSKPPPRKSTSRKRRILRDPDRELISENRTRQQRYKEESRLQTASNVYRALVGNVLICGAKFAAWLSSGSSALMAEFIHSLVDCGNQALLLVGLRNSNLAADRKHPYGYGKSVYFWALVSALGTFFLGAGVSMSHALQNLFHPSLQEITTEVWGVLIFSFTVDGYVLNKTIRETMADRPKGVSYSTHLANVRDPATLAILLEDGAACLGVVMALGGIVASHYTANPMYDAVAGVGISALLGAMGLTLVRVNHRFLLGQGVDREITDDIERILLSRRSIDSIGSVQSQWTGPETFSYKAEVDFDGTFLAAKLLPIYQQEFLQIRDTMDDELQVLLALYTEDVMRTVEREVRHVEALIRKRHPGAEYIELEPMSIHADHLAINDNLEDELRRVESDALDRYLRTLKKEGATVAEEPQQPTGTSTP